MEHEMQTNNVKRTDDHYTLKNVRLETGFITDKSGVIGTQSDLFCVEIKNGRIGKIFKNDAKLAIAVDAKGQLMLPAFKDMHIHLDKTLFGLPWQARSSERKSIADMIAYEQEIIPMLLKTSIERAEQLIDLLQKYGTTFARAHVNIDTTSGLRSLENLEKALSNKKNTFGAELVAFPQHGLYYTDSAALMKEAAQFTSISFIGGLDPFSIDKHVEKAIDFTIQLAVDNNKGIDIHLHDTGTGGLRTIEYLIEQVSGHPSLQGKTYISHAFALAQTSQRTTEQLSEQLSEARIGIVSSIPVRNNLTMPIPTLVKHGVEVLVGNDNIQDHWSTFGTGNMLQKANLIAQLYGWETEIDLSRTLRFATNGILPLDTTGTMQWPKTGYTADLVFVDASCSAEAVSRIASVNMVINQGRTVYKQ